MKILLDVTAAKADELQSRYPGLIEGRLHTPASNRAAVRGEPFAVDNGCFAGFNDNAYRRLLSKLEIFKFNCLFVTAPDVVGNARRTAELWKHRYRWVLGWPVAYVAQNGSENMDLPWDEMAAVFIGGDDEFKDSRAAGDIVKTAKIIGKHVHVGRVNTWARFKRFRELGADTCDGTGLCKDPYRMIARIANELSGKQAKLWT